MANIRSLPSGNWNAQVRIKGKAPQSKTFNTKADAESWANQLESCGDTSTERWDSL